jgi:hypothetical protein
MLEVWNFSAYLTVNTFCVISGFRRGVNEPLFPQGCYTEFADIYWRLRTIYISSFQVSLKMGPSGYLESSTLENGTGSLSRNLRNWLPISAV